MPDRYGYEIEWAPIPSAPIGRILVTGCLSYIAAVLAFSIVSVVLTDALHVSGDGAKALAISAGVLGAGFWGWFCWRRLRTRAVRMEKLRRRDLALRTIENARAHADALPGYLAAGNEVLAEAERRFAAHVYGPFWDSVASAGTQIENFGNSILAIRQNEKNYAVALSGAQHTFPAFYALFALPDPQPTIDRYALIVRAAESDYNFSSIWEQRKTAEVIDKRLTAVIGAVHGATARLSAIITELQTSTDAHLAALQSDTAAIREVTTRREDRS